MEIRRSNDRLTSTMGFPILVRQHLYIESGSRFYVRAPLHMLKINDRHQTKNWAGPVKFSPGQVKLHKIKWKRKFCGRLNENFSFEHCSICTDLCQKCVSSIHWFSWESPAQLNHITYMFSKPSISFHFTLHSIFLTVCKSTSICRGHMRKGPVTSSVSCLFSSVMEASD